MLKRNGLNRLPRNTKTRTIQTDRYQKQVPGHHVQMDVKFLTPLTNTFFDLICLKQYITIFMKKS